MARFAFPLLLLGAVVLGWSAIFTRFSEVGPIATGFYRMVLALPVFLAWAAIDDRRAAGDPPKGMPKTRRDVYLLILSGVFFAGDLTAWHWSIKLTTVGNATLFGNSSPVFVAIAAFVLFGERVTRLFLGGLLLAMVGAAVLMRESFSVSPETFLGDILGVITGMFYAGYILTVARVRQRVSTGATMAIGGLTAAILLAIGAALTEDQLIPITLNGWLWLFALAYICQLGGQSLLIMSLAYLPASFGAVALLVQPIITSLLGWWLLAEAITVEKALGMMTILAGIWLARRGTPQAVQGTAQNAQK
jgi:drug/metabolite transporter (DMT)-like permease